MSCGYVTSYLFVNLKNKEDYEKFETMFDDSEHCKTFQIIGDLDDKPNGILFGFTSDEASWHQDDYIVDFDKWLFENFKVHLQGHWIVTNDATYRCELHHGEICEIDVDWLYENYTVEQIKKLKKIAEELDK